MSDQLTVQEKPKNTPVLASAQSLIEMAITNGADIDKLEKLMALQERYDAKNAKSSYLQAVSMFQTKCPVIITKKQGHGYKYAPLGDIVSQIKDMLFHCGLSYRFEQEQEGSVTRVKCVISHIEGHSESLTMEGGPDNQMSKQGNKVKTDIQATGSTSTYLRRYTLTGALGIVTADEDSDGRVASSMKIEHCDSSQIIKINELIEETGVDRNIIGSLVNQTFGMSCTSFAQYTKEQADYAINKLESKL